MPDLSARLGLPYLMPAQAQKHVTHNEALALLDLLVQLTVQAFDALTPPPAPVEGQIWALGPAPAGAWASHGGQLAAWLDGAWLFIAPQEGWCATQITAQGTTLRLFTAAGWVTPAAGALDNLTGLGVNTAHDATNRLAVASAATLLSHDGDGHQLKINKAAAGDTASLLFQTGWSGRAEMGTAGNDDWSVKVSPDGADWHTALAADGGTGQVTLPNGLSVGGALGLPAASVTRAALAAGNALSLIGRSAASSGAVDDIAAGSDHQVMRRAGSAIGFGAVALNQSAAVSGLLPVANGGTGAATVATARTSLGLGTAAIATVTQSPTDTTAGRLLTTGAGPAQAFRRGNVLGTVSQSGGVPTQALMESDFVAGRGFFERYACGHQICWHVINPGDPTFSGSGTFNDPYRTESSEWLFPAAFSDIPVVNMTTRRFTGSAGQRWFATGMSNISATEVTGIQAIRIGNNVSTGGVAILLSATGRWFNL